jgi:hypothetical protein
LKEIQCKSPPPPSSQLGYEPLVLKTITSLVYGLANTQAQCQTSLVLGLGICYTLTHTHLQVVMQVLKKIPNTMTKLV